MAIIRTILAIGLVLSVSGCDRVEALFKPKPVPKGPYAYTIHLQVTPAAVAEMKKRHYHFNVHAFYYGQGKTAKAPGADSLNRIELGYEANGYDADARVIGMAGDTINATVLPQVADAKPFVLITVLGVNANNFQNELLICDNYVGAISDAQARSPLIRCHLSFEAGFPPQ